MPVHNCSWTHACRVFDPLCWPIAVDEPSSPGIEVIDSLPIELPIKESWSVLVTDDNLGIAEFTGFDLEAESKKSWPPLSGLRGTSPD